jgi:7,8-dihydropterin-6-yl-methyl-4-(beta-D-ribofuranosyl)aminobenzene 5'-phosphate synthase
MLKVSILTDDQAGRRGMLAEHGLSLWIEKDDKRILFDTGQTQVFRHNAKVMGVDLTKTDFVILSHGHYDHCGGLGYFPAKAEPAKIYVHPDLFQKRLVVDADGESRQIGVPWDINNFDLLRGKFVYNRQPLLIESGIMISGEIPKTNTFEEAQDCFFVEKDGKIMPDTFLDEQMLVIEENNGIAVFLGCSHPGVINCLNYAQQLYPNKDILLLVAGMHMAHVSSQRLQKTIQCISDLGVRKVVPLHCTGFTAMCEMKRLLGDRCMVSCTGDTIEL